ncbi:MAG: efflux RND transporter periplasmic adaptor subunit [Deltaproteobacteria bacterium]
MKSNIKITLFGASVLALVIVLISCGGGETARNDREMQDEEQMHGEHEGEAPGMVNLSPESLKTANIEVEEASLKLLNDILQVTGKVYFNENKLAHIGSRVAGRILQLRANLGDRVEEGAILAVIDSIELGEAESRYLRLRANLDAQEKSLERARTLLDGKAIPLGEFQRREAEYISVRAEFRAAEDRLGLLGVSKGEILKSGAVNSKYSVRAPFAGTIVERQATIGEIIEPAANLFMLADLSALWVIADISERDISLIQTGLAVEIMVSAYPNDLFKGVITYIGDMLDSSTRTVKIRTEVDNSVGKLKPEMFASVNILTEGEENVLAIPESALQRDGEDTFVFIAKGEYAFEKRVVAVGPAVRGFHRVISGIEPGEGVVTGGAFILKSELQKGELDGHGH